MKRSLILLAGFVLLVSAAAEAKPAAELPEPRYGFNSPLREGEFPKKRPLAGLVEIKEAK